MRMSSPTVFLGGSCDAAIPALEVAGVSYYVSRRDESTPETSEERFAKESAAVSLFVIDGRTRAMDSILEAVEAALDGRFVAVVVDDIEDGAVIDGEVVTGRQLQDLNRARAYLRDLVDSDRTWATRRYESVNDAVEHLASVYGHRKAA